MNIWYKSKTVVCYALLKLLLEVNKKYLYLLMANDFIVLTGDVICQDTETVQKRAWTHGNLSDN